MKGLVIFATLFSVATHGADFTYNKIAERNQDAVMSAAEMSEARMQGECLVGLKDLNFKKKNEFDPVAEWTSFRSSALLRQFPPCQVLVMMEVAQQALKEREKAQQ